MCRVLELAPGGSKSRMRARGAGQSLMASEPVLAVGHLVGYVG